VNRLDCLSSMEQVAVSVKIRSLHVSVPITHRIATQLDSMNLILQNPFRSTVYANMSKLQQELRVCH